MNVEQRIPAWQQRRKQTDSKTGWTQWESNLRTAKKQWKIAANQRPPGPVHEVVATLAARRNLSSNPPLPESTPLPKLNRSKLSEQRLDSPSPLPPLDLYQMRFVGLGGYGQRRSVSRLDAKIAGQLRSPSHSAGRRMDATGTVALPKSKAALLVWKNPRFIPRWTWCPNGLRRAFAFADPRSKFPMQPGAYD